MQRPIRIGSKWFVLTLLVVTGSTLHLARRHSRISASTEDPQYRASFQPDLDLSHIDPEATGLPDGTNEQPEVQVTEAGTLSFRSANGMVRLFLDDRDLGISDGILEVPVATWLAGERVLLVSSRDGDGSAVMPPHCDIRLVRVGPSDVRITSLSQSPIHDLAELGIAAWRKVADRLEMEVTHRGMITYCKGQLGFELLPEYELFVEQEAVIQREVQRNSSRPVTRIDLGSSTYLVLSGRLARKPVLPENMESPSEQEKKGYALILQSPVHVEDLTVPAEINLAIHTFRANPKHFDPWLGKELSLEVSMGFNDRGALLFSEDYNRIVPNP